MIIFQRKIAPPVRVYNGEKESMAVTETLKTEIIELKMSKTQLITEKEDLVCEMKTTNEKNAQLNTELNQKISELRRLGICHIYY